MRHTLKRKNEDANTTRDGGTNPPEPHHYDRFEPDSSKYAQAVRPDSRRNPTSLRYMSAANHLSRAPGIKNEVSQQLNGVLIWIRHFKRTLDEARTAGHRLRCMERDLREIKAAKKGNSPSNDLRVKCTTTPANAVTYATERTKCRELQEHLKKQRELYEIPLTTTKEETKKKLTDMRPHEITKCGQHIIDNDTNRKSKLNGINKIANGIRLRCKLHEDAEIQPIGAMHSKYSRSTSQTTEMLSTESLSQN